MHTAISLVLLIGVVIGVAAASRRLDLPTPLVLIAVGIGGSFLPYLGEFRLTEEIVLVGLLPPLLYAASLQTSLVDFKTHRKAILLLSVGLVAFTALGVGVVVHLVLPGVSWPAAFAIGAVVSPPDAVAATAIARRIGLPRQIVTVLEGESLLNDATALVALRTAIVGATGVVAIGADFLWAAGAGVAAGLLVYALVAWARRHLTDPVLDAGISLVTPFAAYVLAEEVHASGVLAVVTAGLMLGHRAPVLQTASARITERLNWQTISFLLENSVFLLIGLQASWIIREVGDSPLSPGRIALVCLAALLATVLLRPVWVFTFHALLFTPSRRAQGRSTYSWRAATVISWAGMRGVVTLAAAFAIPEGFEHREVLLLVAFTVTAATLFGQGLTLPWLARKLDVPGPDPRQDALARATLFQDASIAGLAELEKHVGEDDPYDTVAALRQRIEQRDFAAWERLGGLGPETEAPSEAYARLRLAMLQAERAKVLEVRDSGRVPQEVVEDVLRSLDVEESMLEVRRDRREELRDYLAEVAAVTTREACVHLDEATDIEVPDETACVDCIAEGTTWVHLRTCLTCGHVGCCDSSPRRHATRHHRETDHPVVRSAEPGETWRWCFVDQIVG